MRVMGVRAAMALLAVLGIGSGAPIRLVLAPDGTEARYRVREQLAELSLPSDAVGVTHDVTGRLGPGAQGRGGGAGEWSSAGTRPGPKGCGAPGVPSTNPPPRQPASPPPPPLSPLGGGEIR